MILHHKTALRALLLGAALGALAACQSEPTNAVATPTASRSTKIVERDVEAPQIYQVSEQALWDGRPSLGGVWVASPDTRDPERVIMRNPANGKFVIGALFKRERDNPGPKLQISSDAAESLGILAGQPVKISVTALRREEAPLETPRAPSLDSNEDLVSAAAPLATSAQPAEVTKGPLAPVAPRATPTNTVAAAAPKAPAPAPANTPSAAPVEIKAERASSFTSPPQPAPTAKAASQSPAAQTTAATATTGATTALDTAEAKASAPPVAKPAASAARAIQVGIFSIEANAERARAQVAKTGTPAHVRKGSAGGKDYWSVTAQGDAAALKKIRSAGFADAYLLK